MRTARVMMAGALAALAACSGGGDDGGGGTAPAVFTTLAVDPPAATLVTGETQTLTPSARDQSGAQIPGLATTYTSANQAIATVTSEGVVTAVAQGSTTIAVNGTIGTVTKNQNVTVEVVVPQPTASVATTGSNTFAPATVAVIPNGVVTWTFGAQHNVTFDTPGAPGNIADKTTGTASLTFPTAGRYLYHCTIHGPTMKGIVVVK